MAKVYVVIRSDYGAWGFRTIEAVYTNNQIAREHAATSNYLTFESYEPQYSIPTEGTDQMGMFDRDKEIGAGLTAIFNKKEEFILWGATVDADKVQTDIGPARKTRLTVSRPGSASNKFEVTTLASAIADKAEEADSGEFPVVVMWTTAHSKTYGTEATVLQYVRDYSA